MKANARKRRTEQRRLKKGRAFEECVATVIRALSPNATVSQGTWVEGPDGRRDQDVLIETTIDGKPFRTLVECKDYDPAKTGPVGIKVLDELDSKSRDLSFDLAIICSNAGFTEPAMRKAQRLGIVLLGILREGDARVRHHVLEFVYFRRIKIDRLAFRLERKTETESESCLDISASYAGAPVANWVCHYSVDSIIANPIGAGSYAGSFRLKTPTAFTLASGETFTATNLHTELTLSGGWFEQVGTIDGMTGIYDFLRRRIRVASGPYKIHFKGLDLTKGSPVTHPPRQEVDFPNDSGDEDLWLQLLYLIDCNCHHPIPPIHELVAPEDLDTTVSGLVPELQRTPSNKLRAAFTGFVARNPRVGPDHSFTISGYRK